MNVFETFINIDAFAVLKSESIVAFTDALAIFVDTFTMLTTINALADIINIAFGNSITGETRFTLAIEAAQCIDAVCILMAVMRVFQTFVDIFTSPTV